MFAFAPIRTTVIAVSGMKLEALASYISLCQLCMYAAGILRDDDSIDNEASILRLAEIAVAYAKAGKVRVSCMPTPTYRRL